MVSHKYIYYKCIESVADPSELLNYITEILNSLSHLSPHKLNLNVVAPIRLINIFIHQDSVLEPNLLLKKCAIHY